MFSRFFTQQIRKYASSTVPKRQVNMFTEKLPKTEPWAMTSSDWIKTGLFFGFVSGIGYILTAQSSPFMNITKKKRSLLFEADKSAH